MAKKRANGEGNIRKKKKMAGGRDATLPDTIRRPESPSTRTS